MCDDLFYLCNLLYQFGIDHDDLQEMNYSQDEDHRNIHLTSTFVKLPMPCIGFLDCFHIMWFFGYCVVLELWPFHFQ